MIVAGTTANGYGGGYVSGHDARNGEELWRKELIPHPGEPVDETWAGTPFESRWHTGVWGHITYDPDLDLVYYGSSGVAPASEAQRKAPGATLAGTDTRFAVHPKTGEIVWRHQTLPRDNWDQECTFEMMVINTPVNPDARAGGMMSINPDARKGTRKTLTGIPCKTGIAWSFDAATGEFLWAKQTTAQNLVTNIGPKGQVTVNEDMVMKDVTKTYSICPTYAGGRDWPMGAYSPKTNAFFVPLTNLCIDVKTKPDTPTPAQGYNTAATGKFAPGKDKVGRIDAVSAETGRTLWSWETRVSNYSPVLATGGGLLFNGGMDRFLRALDIDRGQVVWETRLPSQVVGGAVTYSVQRAAICGRLGRRRGACRAPGRHDAGSRHDQRQQRDLRLRACRNRAVPARACRRWKFALSGRASAASFRAPCSPLRNFPASRRRFRWSMSTPTCSSPNNS
jgi:alcohol dehydrogenase (cytochrome c)